jgi:hypothetical protein
MNEDEMQRGTAREWLAARVVVVGGFLIAIAVAAYFTLRPAPQPVTEAQPAAQQQPMTAQQAASQNAKDAMLVCAQELVNAKNSGIVPASGQLANAFPKATSVRARYVCTAATSAAKYLISADLVCRDLLNSRCVRLYSITDAHGMVLYQRQG